MAADLEKIAESAVKIREIAVSMNDAFAAYAKAFHAAQDATLLLASQIEEEAGAGNGDGNGDGNGNGNGNGGTGGTGGPVGPLEAVKPGVPQGTIQAGREPRQEWWAFGHGCGGFAHAAKSLPLIKANRAKLTTGCNAKIMRIFTPEQDEDCLEAYRPIWEVYEDEGVDTIHSSSYIYAATQNPKGVFHFENADPRGVARGIAKVIAGGIRPKVWGASLQNEWDAPANGNGNTYTELAMRHQFEFWDELRIQGLLNIVRPLSIEWRHPRTKDRVQREFDMNDSKGRVGLGKPISALDVHFYDKTCDENDYEARYLKRGLGVWSTETGNMGPHAITRMMCGIAHGTEVEIAHIGQATTDTEDAENKSQKLIRASGQPNTWYYAPAEYSKELHRGTRFRHCLSSTAGQMVWAGWSVRHVVNVGLRPDGSWLVAGCNYAGGNPEQLTVKIPELDGKNVQLTGKRVDQGGKISGAVSPLRDGETRFTLAKGETIILAGKAA